MKECVIFGGGEYDAQRPVKTPETLVIAADAGYRHCVENGMEPDFAVGDFDSLGGVPSGPEVIRLPVEKDTTDMDAATLVAARNECKVFHLYGGMGGRPDHTLANYALVARLSQQGAAAYLYGDGYVVTAVTDGTLTLTGGRGETVSVFSWTDRSEGVTLRGLKYPLENAELVNTFALGVSNSFAAETAEISVKHGTLIVMRQIRS